jgi:hypothetical protein
MPPSLKVPAVGFARASGALYGHGSTLDRVNPHCHVVGFGGCSSRYTEAVPRRKYDAVADTGT